MARQCLRYPTRQSIILSAKSGRNTIYLRFLHPSASTRSCLTPYGQKAQVDFGEAWMRKENGISIKIYFFAHELAFQFWQGKPRKIIYDQDKIFTHREDLGDYILTKAFHTFVKEQNFQPVFCRKAAPESKGKIENVVKYEKKNFFYGRTSHNIETLVGRNRSERLIACAQQVHRVQEPRRKHRFRYLDETAARRDA